MWINCTVATLLLALAMPAAAQVTVAPTVVGTSDRDRFTSYLVLNQTDRAQEVTVGFRFGYPAPGENFSTTMVYDSTTDATRYSMSAWARAFPVRFLLGPGERQTVRILVTPPPGLSDGVYWTRLVTTSAPVSPPIDTVAPNVRAQITVKIEQVTTLLFRRGAATSGVRIGDLTTRVDSAGVHFIPELERTGNAPFLGSVTARVFDRAGKTAGEATQILGIYFTARPDLVVEPGTLRPGEYTVEITARADRTDVPQDQRVAATPASRRLQVIVP